MVTPHVHITTYTTQLLTRVTGSKPILIAAGLKVTGQALRVQIRSDTEVSGTRRRESKSRASAHHQAVQ